MDVFLCTVTDSKGTPVTAILELQPTNKGGQILDMNVIASAYGKGNTKNLVESSGLVYIDPNKKRTKSWMQGLGLQLPSDTTALGSVGSITYLDGNVKIKSVPYGQYMQKTSDVNAVNAKTDIENTKKWNQVGDNPQGSRSTDRFLTDSTVSISDLLDSVNRYFPDILPEDVLKHYGYDARPAGDLGKDALYSERDKNYAKVAKQLEAQNEKFREVYAKLSPDQKDARDVRQMKDVFDRLQTVLAEALVDASENFQAASENFQAAQENATADSGVKMQARSVNGKEVVWIEDNILKENKGLPVHQFIANYIAKHIGEVYTIIESGQKVYIGEELPREYTQSKYTKELLRSNSNIIKAKNKAVANMGEMIEIATNRRWEKTKHPGNKDARYGMYRYDTYFGFPAKNANGDVTGANIYAAELLVRNASDGKKYLYDIVSIKKDTATPDWLTQRVTSAAGKPAGQKSGVSTERVSQQSADVNTKFQLRDSVEYTKDLVALHNLTEDKLEKSLKLGGFPMPSIAVTRSDIPHTNFGDITLVFGKETVDPKANRKNTVYSADAWTPTFPQIEYEADGKATSRVYKQLTGLAKQVDEYFRRDLGDVTYNIGNVLNQYGGEEGVVQAALDNYGLKAAYLEEQGQHITPETKQETVGIALSDEIQDRFVKIMDILDVYAPEQIGALSVKEVLEQHGAELEAVYPGITKSGSRLGRLLNRVKAWLQGDTRTEVKAVIDEAATRNAVDSAIDKTEFEAWVRNLYKGVEKSSGIYNGKERYTASGDLKSFKQTHLPATLEGIVKAMAAQNNGNTKNVSGFNGVKSLRAGTAERFASIADMHEREGRLQHLTQEQADRISDALQNRTYELIERIDKANSRKGDSNSLIRFDTIGEILLEISEGDSYNVADIQRVFAEYSRAIGDDLAIEIKQLLFDISQMPVNIFEAKPERAVAFSEIKAAVLPNGTSQAVVNGLQQNGVPVMFYEKGNNEQRLEVVNSLEEVKFSERDRQYSYDSLISKPDMKITTVSTNVPKNRADVVYQAKQNAAKVGKFDPKTGSVSVYVDDIGTDVLLGTDGLKHGLRRTKDPQNDANYIVTMKAGEIIKNSIQINEMTPKKVDTRETLVLIGIARNPSGDAYVVRSVVNRFSNELTSIDALYAINAKKEELAATKSPRFTAEPLSETSSTISIAELLDLVNQYFPDVLPEDVLKHYGYDARPAGDLGKDALYSERDKNYKASHKGEQYSSQETDFDYSDLNWASDLGIITAKDRAIFERTINNEIFRGAKPQSANGEYIIDTGKCLMFTDGDFHNPTLTRVIEFATEYESLTADAKEMMIDEAKVTGDVQKSLSAIEKMFGPGFVSNYTRPDGRSYAGQNRGGKRSNGSGTAQRTGAKSLKERLAEEGKEHLLYSERLPNDVSNRSLLANAFEGITKNSEEYELIQEYRGRTARGHESLVQLHAQEGNRTG